MRCSSCGHDTHVTNSRYHKDRNERRRRRECTHCGRRTSSIELDVKRYNRIMKQNQETEKLVTTLRKALGSVVE